MNRGRKGRKREETGLKERILLYKKSLVKGNKATRIGKKEKKLRKSIMNEMNVKKRKKERIKEKKKYEK